jgi:hypothetical protein
MSWKSDDLACCSSGEQYRSQSEIRAVELCRKVSLTLLCYGLINDPQRNLSESLVDKHAVVLEKKTKCLIQ